MFMLHKILNFILLADLDPAKYHVVSYTMERATWQRTDHGLWLTSCNKVRTSVQRHTKIWMLTPIIIAWKWIHPQLSLRWDHSPSQHLESKLMRLRSRRYSWTMPQLLIHRNYGITNVCCFKLLNFKDRTPGMIVLSSQWISLLDFEN